MLDLFENHIVGFLMRRLKINVYFQNELHRKYPRGIGEGEIAVVRGGKLHCQKVYFVSMIQSEREGVSDSKIKEVSLYFCFQTY